ncbi:beta-parvin-like isoform X1 [Ptychodera flava]|uniref:beta-parvin-like isoform X1 n=1 Tax=Ptychodera flava TaxID=63121 RepID=UPI00396A9D4C
MASPVKPPSQAGFTAEPTAPFPWPGTKKEDRDESLFDKVATLGRKKRMKEVADLQEDGKHAIDSPTTSPVSPEIIPDIYNLEENEERSLIEIDSRDDFKLRELIKVLLDWINEELQTHRIIVKDIEEDLFDGQVLGKLVERLANIKLEVAEVTQSEAGQKKKLKAVLDEVNKILNLPRWHQQKWSVDSIHSKNLIAILHLLVALAFHFKAPIRIPEHVAVQVVVLQKKDGMLHTRHVTEEITSTNDAIGGRFERDAFDTLFDHAPDKLSVVKKSLITFVNKHLNKINLEVTDLDTQFCDGVYLVLLMGLLEGYFVPLYCYHLTPTTFEHKVHNVQFALELMHDAGLPKAKARPEDVVNLDLKSTLRVLYNLFTKYKHLG